MPEKSKWLSRGWWGSIVAAACATAVLYGVPDLATMLGFESQGELVDWLVKGAGLFGAVMGAIGRLRATTMLK